MTQSDESAIVFSNATGALKSLIRFSTPVSAVYGAEMIIGVTDVIIATRISSEAVAAVGLIDFLSYAVMALIAGIQSMFGIQVAQALSLGNKTRACSHFLDSIWFAAIVAIPIVLLFWNISVLLEFFGLSSTIVQTSRDFCQGISFAFLPFILFGSFKCFVEAVGIPRVAAICVWTAVPVNGLAVYALALGTIGLPELGVFGMGLGSTVTSCWLLLSIGAVVLTSPTFREVLWTAKGLKPTFWHWKKIITSGVNHGAAMSTQFLFISVMGVFMGRTDTLNLATFNAVMILLSFYSIFSYALADGVSYGMAVAKLNGSKLAQNSILWSGVLAGALISILFSMFALSGLLGAILDWIVAESASAIGVPEASQLLVIICILQGAETAWLISSGVLRGLMQTSSILIITTFVYIGTALVMVISQKMFPLNATSIWVGTIFAYVATAGGLLFVVGSIAVKINRAVEIR